MEKSERETIIRINDADMDLGFFSLSTSIRAVAEKLSKKFNKYIISCKEYKSSDDGHTTEWMYRIDAAVCPRSPYLALKQRRVLPPEEIERLKAIGRAGQEAFKARKPITNV